MPLDSELIYRPSQLYTWSQQFLVIGGEVHGEAVNLDGFETHDTRRIIPGVGFSIEPGIYLP